MRKILTAVAVVGLMAGSIGTAEAALVPAGTLSVAIVGSPTISIGASQSTYSFNAPFTFEYSGTGGFASANGGMGTLTGSFTFSNTVGTTDAISVSPLFTFSGFTFAATSVTTQTFSATPGTSVSGSLYLLGNISSSTFGATPTSMTLSFNQTAASAFSSSATLATPPSSSVPEPASWALMLVGFGAIGAAARRRTTVRFA